MTIRRNTNKTYLELAIESKKAEMDISVFHALEKRLARKEISFAEFAKRASHGKRP